MAHWTIDQQKAIDVRGTNAIISAGAGSGKTAVLTERVFNIIKEGTDIDELLVLTFTRAAAQEMKSRIKSKLMKDESLMAMAEKVESSNITTFDAYALSLVKKYYYVLGVSPMISIVSQDIIDVRVNDILKDLFDEEYENLSPTFKELIFKYAKKDDFEIRRFIKKVDDFASLQVDKKAYINDYISKRYDDVYFENGFKEYLKLVKQQFMLIQDEVMDIDNTTFGDKVDEFCTMFINHNNYNEMVKAIHEISFPRYSLPKGYRKSDNDKRICNKIVSIRAYINDLLSFSSYEDIKKEYFQTQEDTELIISFVKKLNERLDVFKNTYSCYTFNDIFKMALKLLKYEDIRQEIRDSLKYIMIDEYQDTSNIQDLFISQIANNNVYMVGDIKQSIYRFRDANPRIFQDKYLSYSRGEGGLKIDLNNNFRSRHEVLDDINLMFSNVMTENHGGAEYKLNHIIIPGNKSYENNDDNHHTEIYTYNKDNNYNNTDIEAHLIAQDILSKVGRFSVYDKELEITRPAEFRDFVVLISTKTHFDDSKKIFDEYHIPTSVEKEDMLLDSMMVNVFNNYLFLCYSYQKGVFGTKFLHAFASVARSFLYSYTDEKIYDYVHNGTYLVSNVMQDIKKICLPEEQDLGAFVMKAIDVVDFESKLILIGDIEDNLSKLETLVNSATQMTTLGYTLEDFIDYLDSLSEYDIKLKSPKARSKGNMVRFMSIHSSKGLEFPIVYYPAIDKTYFDETKDSCFMCNEKYGLIYPSLLTDEHKSIFFFLAKEYSKIEDESEQVRLFYVAMTRAREKMIMLHCNEIEPNKHGLSKRFSDLVNAGKFPNTYYVMKKVETFESNVSVKEHLSAEKLTFLSNNLTSKLIKKSHASKESYDYVDPHVFEYGTHLHYLMELADLKTRDLSYITDSYERILIQKFLDLDIIKESTTANVFKEYEFVDDEQNMHGIIDLMVVYDDKIIIVDYKTKHIDDAAYSGQLRAYKQYAEKVFNKPVTTYLYSIIDSTLKKTS